MEITIKKPVRVEVKYLQAICGCRYWEDATINGEEADEDGSNVPCKVGDTWQPLIELETGKILNWKQGVKADIHFKVCDEGIYKLLDGNKHEVKMIDGYVIDMMCPKDNGYGDYVIMDIDENGFIQDWEVDLEPFESDEE